MKCVYCGNNTSVTNSRLQKQSNSIWRRRRCETCKNVFSTKETINLAQALCVELTEGKLTPFDRDILFISIYSCLKHRKQPIKDASELTNTIITKLTKSQQAVFSSADIIQITVATLKQFDSVAQIQYNAFHKI